MGVSYSLTDSGRNGGSVETGTVAILGEAGWERCGKHVGKDSVPQIQFLFESSRGETIVGYNSFVAGIKLIDMCGLGI